MKKLLTTNEWRLCYMIPGVSSLIFGFLHVNLFWFYIIMTFVVGIGLIPFTGREEAGD